jgi:hypothetical protein
MAEEQRLPDVPGLASPPPRLPETPQAHSEGAASHVGSPQTPITLPSSPDEPQWAKRLRHIGPLGPLISPVVLLISAFVALIVFFEARKQNATQRENSTEQLTQLRNSLTQNNLTTIYTLGSEILKFQQAHPKLAKFFDKELRPSTTEEQLKEEYEKLSEEERTLIYLGSEQLADFSQIAFMQRDILPADDWDTWWSYITDQYDESPIYRDFLLKRSAWYAFLEEVKPENRAKYYRGYQKR